MAVRTFVALDLDDEALDALERACSGLADPQDKVRWVARGNRHVTLNFLGEVADANLSDVCGVVADVGGGVEPFDFVVSGLKCVPRGGPVRMIWACVQDPTGRLVELQESLSLALEGLGFRGERRGYAPHVTLARIKYVKDVGALRRATDDWAAADFGVQHAQQVVTYTSELTSDGPVYTPAAHAVLGA